MKFGTILADPPWHLGVGYTTRTAAAHYVVRTPEWVCGLPVGEVAATDAALLLWAPGSVIHIALRVVEAWGFDYKTMVTWAKMARAGAPRIGLGFHVRTCTEHLLIGTRGKVGAPPTGDRSPSLIFNDRGEHSKKPEVQYDLAEAYPGPYLELFNRPRDGGLFPPRPGWTFLGNEVDGRDIREALAELSGCPLEVAA